MAGAAPRASAPGAAAADLAPHELRILVAVARERGFSAAARALGLTQS
ncbi:helix-turn-helix domain-containing protein, partial [Streptomyces phytophilus]